jgi:CheY-like chemotaxis protein
MVLNHKDAAGKKPLVLIVDDHDQNLELLEAYLEDVNVRVQTSSSGQDALTKIAAEQPQLILLDIMMPRMSGWQVAAKLRSDGATKHIPIIMVTALGEASDIERAHDLGVMDFLTKPVNKVDLLARVRAQLAS